jgi:hypothetical protein
MLVVSDILWGMTKRLYVILLCILVTHGGSARAQYSSSIDTLEDAARAAQSGDAAAVRVLTDTVMNQLPLRFHPSLNLNDRLFDAELQYRQQKRRGVSVEQVVSALNQLATDEKLPAYVKTNANQVRTYGMMSARVYPLFFSLPSGANQTADFSLSPSAAMSLLVQLFHMKMIEPSYQTDPDTWARDTQAKMKEAASRPPSRSLSFYSAIRSPEDEALERRYEGVARDIARHSDRTVRAVQAMLKTLVL